MPGDVIKKVSTENFDSLYKLLLAQNFKKKGEISFHICNNDTTLLSSQTLMKQ